MMPSLSMEEVSPEKVTLEKMYAFLSYFHRTGDNQFELGFSPPSTMVWKSCEMSNEQLLALDQRLPRVMDVILSNPLRDEILEPSFRKQRLATADCLRLNFDYWRRGAEQYIWDDIENKATLWTSLSMRGANKDIAIESTSFSLAKDGVDMVFLKKHAKRFECGTALEMDVTYPGLSTAYMVATQLGLDAANTIAFCVKHVFNRNINNTKKLPQDLTFGNF